MPAQRFTTFRVAALVVAVAGCLAASCTSDVARGSADRPSGSPGGVGPSTPSAHVGGVIAFTSETRGQVSTIKPDGSAARELVSGAACCSALSPDGTRVMFLTTRADGVETTGITSTDGSREVIDPPAHRNLVPGAWSPDGSRVALGMWDSTVRGANGVVITSGPDAPLERLTRPAGAQFDLPLQWSPDGRLILFVRVPRNDDPDVEGNLYVVPVEGGVPVQLNPAGTRVRYLFVGPGNFFPDSSRVAFVAGHQKTRSDGPSTWTGRLWVASVDGRDLKPVTEPMLFLFGTRVSPDGQWLVFDRALDDRGGRSLVVARPDGSDEHVVQSSGTGNCCAVWSPDSKWLLFSHGGESNNLWVAEVDGTGVVELTKTGGQSFADYGWGGPAAG